MTSASDTGYTLVEVLIATAVASVVLAGAAGLLGASARAVRESGVETSATLLASSRLEEWRWAPDVVTTDLALVADGTVAVQLTAAAEPGSAGVWRVSVTVTSVHLRQPLRLETLIAREAS